MSCDAFAGTSQDLHQYFFPDLWLFNQQTEGACSYTLDSNQPMGSSILTISVSFLDFNLGVSKYGDLWAFFLFPLSLSRRGPEARMFSASEPARRTESVRSQPWLFLGRERVISWLSVYVVICLQRNLYTFLKWRDNGRQVWRWQWCPQPRGKVWIQNSQQDTYTGHPCWAVDSNADTLLWEFRLIAAKIILRVFFFTLYCHNKKYRKFGN